MANYSISFAGISQNEFIRHRKSRLEVYRSDLTQRFSKFSNPTIILSDEFKKYVSESNITIKANSSGIQKDEKESFYSAINRLTISLF